MPTRTVVSLHKNSLALTSRLLNLAGVSKIAVVFPDLIDFQLSKWYIN